MNWQINVGNTLQNQYIQDKIFHLCNRKMIRKFISQRNFWITIQTYLICLKTLRHHNLMKSYIEQAGLPVLHSNIIECLEEAICEVEIKRYWLTQNRKEPGPYGFTPRFYKVLSPLVVQILVSTFNATVDSHHHQWKCLWHIFQLYRNLISICSNFRPISILNIDMKIFAKILACRLSPNLSILIHQYQVDFITHCEVKDNTTKTINLIYLKKIRFLHACYELMLKKLLPKQLALS